MSRGCPKCARERSRKQYRRYKVVKWTWPTLLTLTLKVGPDLPALVDLALSAWTATRLRFHELRKGIRSVEVVRKPDGWFVHIHALTDCQWIDGEALGAFWLAQTGSYIKDIKRVGPKWSRGRDLDGALLEVTKYVTKDLGSLSDADAYALYVATFGRRLVSHWGMAGDSLLDTQETIMVCAICKEALKYDGRMFEKDWDAYYGQFEACPVIYLDDT